ncbi:MAG: helix-turn-helix transcriptional regulator [Clostridia bacterium]|nr:helix-turn-helix transcriptional regulator [Clostridia bacterium]
MVDTNRLKGVIVQNGKTQGDVAERIGITPKTFYAKMKKGVFGSDEIEKMIDFLNIDDPMQIFFAKNATSKVTETKKGGK